MSQDVFEFVIYMLPALKNVISRRINSTES